MYRPKDGLPCAATRATGMLGGRRGCGTRRVGAEVPLPLPLPLPLLAAPALAVRAEVVGRALGAVEQDLGDGPLLAAAEDDGLAGRGRRAQVRGQAGRVARAHAVAGRWELNKL